MTADPICPQCNRKMVWIGVGPGAEAVCPQDCAPAVPKFRCPGCKSPEIEPYHFPSIDDWHCQKCGKVFDKKDAL